MQGHDYPMPIPFPRAFRTSPPPTELKMFGELPEEIPTSVKSEPDSQGEPLIPTQNSPPAPYSIDSTPPRLELRMRNLQSPFLSSPSETSDGFSQKRNFTSMSRGEGPIKNRGPSKCDPNNEALPQTAINHPNFLAAEELALQIPGEILEIVSQCDYSDEDFEYLREMAVKAQRISYAAEVKIGLKGDSGTGKSSLINSILGYDGIAPCGDVGEACTAVVQEFRKPRPSQQTPFEAEVIFLSPVARDAALRSWVSDFWDTRKSGVGGDEEEGDEDYAEGESDVDDEIAAGQGSATAADAIFSLFSNRDECKDLETTKKFLSTAKMRGDPRIISQLKVWLDALFQNLGVDSGKYTITAPTPDLLQEEVAPFLQHVNGERPSPWPLVKIVRTFIDCEILSQDIVLADLPGTNDVNQTRIQATKMYMSGVDHTGVVARIERAQTDASTHRSLVEAYKRKRGPNIFMVATHADCINHCPNKYMSMQSSSPSHVRELSALKDELDMLALELESIKLKKDQAKASKDFDMLDELDTHADELRAKKLAKESRSLEICRTIRNQKVRKFLVHKHYNMMKKEILPVFCVSNSEYMAHVVGYDQDHVPKMSIEATEIPRLRAYIYALPAQRKMVAFKHHVKFKLPSLINSLAMTCSISRVKRREQLERILMEAYEPISQDISQVFKNFLMAEIVGTLGKMKMAKSKAAYSATAKENLAEYSMWTSVTQKAFFKHKGKWSTKKVGRHDWNARILEPLVKDLEKDLRRWDDLSEGLSRNLSEKIVGTLQSLIQKLEDEAGPSKGVLRPFFDQLRLHIDRLDEECKLRAETVEKEFSLIKASITSTAESDQCYLIQSLEETYQSCAAMTGQDVRKKRLETLKDKLAEKGVKGPWNSIHDKAKKDAQKLIQQHTQEFSDQIREIFKAFHDIFMRLFKTEQSDAPEAKALRHKLMQRHPGWLEKITTIQSLIQECEGLNAPTQV